MKSDKKAFTIRIDPVLFSQYEDEAKEAFRSINQHLECVLTNLMDTKLESKRKLHKLNYGDASGSGLLNGQA